MRSGKRQPYLMGRGAHAQNNQEGPRQLIFMVSWDVLVGIKEVQGVVARHALSWFRLWIIDEVLN
jgi:hypothetical protein